MKLYINTSSFYLEANSCTCKLGYKFGRGLWLFQIPLTAKYNKFASPFFLDLRPIY